MAKNFLTEHLLSAMFWYFALNYSVQVSNYLLPIHLPDGSISTPYFEAYGVLPDYHKLIPLFSTSHVKRIYTGEGHSFNSQTLKCILIGNDPQSDAPLFYNPATKQLISSANYRLDPTRASGPIFNIPYDGGIQFSLYPPSNQHLRPPAFDLHQPVFTKSSSPEHNPSKAIVIHIPTNDSDIYTIQIPSSQDILEIKGSDLTALPPKSTPDTHFSTLPWIQHHAKVTMHLPLDDEIVRVDMSSYRTLVTY